MKINEPRQPTVPADPEVGRVVRARVADRLMSQGCPQGQAVRMAEASYRRVITRLEKVARGDREE